MFDDDIVPIFEMIDKWEEDGFTGDRATTSPIIEGACVAWWLGRWLEEHDGEALTLPEGGFPSLLAKIYQESWEDIEACADDDAQRLFHHDGPAKAGDIAVTSLECVLAAIKCTNSARINAAWSYIGDARHLSVCVLQGWDTRNRVKKMIASENGERRWANDPKQSAKAEAFKLWQERHAGKHPKLRTSEQFAMECMRRWPVLTSAAVIAGWCTAWNKASKTRKTQPAS